MPECCAAFQLCAVCFASTQQYCLKVTKANATCPQCYMCWLLPLQGPMVVADGFLRCLQPRAVCNCRNRQLQLFFTDPPVRLIAAGTNGWSRNSCGLPLPAALDCTSKNLAIYAKLFIAPYPGPDGWRRLLCRLQPRAVCDCGNRRDVVPGAWLPAAGAILILCSVAQLPPTNRTASM